MANLRLGVTVEARIRAESKVRNAVPQGRGYILQLKNDGAKPLGLVAGGGKDGTGRITVPLTVSVGIQGS